VLAYVLLVLVLTLSGCEDEPRVPYIPPTLVNWPQPYRGVAGLKLHVFNTGYVRESEALVVRGGRLTRTRDLPVPVFVIEHPKLGLILFNTGLKTGKATDSSAQRSWLSVPLTPIRLPGESLVTQMQRAGLKPEAVHWIVLSTLRFDHTGALAAFPNARVVVTQAERESARTASGGYEQGDIDGIANWKFIDFESSLPLATFGAHVDLLGDGSCLLIDASGTTPGTMAMLVRLPHQPLLLADDMAAVEENVRYTARPAFVVDVAKWWDHIWRLKRFKDLVPELIVAPGHDLAPLQAVHSPDIIVHEIRPPAAETPAPRTPDVVQRVIPKPM
jgi:N-acyl homoserine lactone hydrolase